MKSNRAPRRGSDTDCEFASKFVIGRMGGFAKDMRICLTGIPSPNGLARLTYAYFPAFMSCCSTLDYLAGLYLGRTGSLNHRDIYEYATAYMNKSYDADIVRVLFDGFRNSVAHRGISSGVWKDMHPGHAGRRLTWAIDASEHGPALEIKKHDGELILDAPWATPYTHRFHIRLGRLWRDINDSSDRYQEDLATTPELATRFMKSMSRLYPK